MTGVQTCALPILSGCELVRPLGPLPIRWSGGEIPFQAYLFRRHGHDFALAFAIWDPSRGRPLVDHQLAGWRGWMESRLTEVIEARAHQPAQLLSVAVWGAQPAAPLAATIPALIAPLGTPEAAPQKP